MLQSVALYMDEERNIKHRRQSEKIDNHNSSTRILLKVWARTDYLSARAYFMTTVVFDGENFNRQPLLLELVHTYRSTGRNIIVSVSVVTTMFYLLHRKLFVVVINQ